MHGRVTIMTSECDIIRVGNGRTLNYYVIYNGLNNIGINISISGF